MPFIYSTLSNDNEYADYVKGPGIKSKLKSVKIKGGANVDMLSGESLGLIKPYEITEVSDSDLEFLKANDAFNRHLKRGFLSIETKKNVDSIKNLAPADASARKSAKSPEFSENEKILVGGVTVRG